MTLAAAPSHWLLIPDLTCLLVCLLAAWLDVRSRRIPNWLTLPALLAGLVLNGTLFGLLGGGLTAAGVGLAAALAGGLLMLLLFGWLGLIRFVGMGDVKLMIAVGTLLRWPFAAVALVDVAVAGGLVGLGHALLRGRAGAVLGNLLRLGRRALRRDSAAPLPLHRIPYAVAILLGATWTVLGRYLPGLRWP